MKQQVLVIHGGNAFEKYEEYLDYLRGKEFNLEKMVARGWKLTLQEVLGTEYIVLNPQMPNSMNARYIEWKIFFERLIPILDDNVILVGHSLGGIFLAKYLSERKLPKKIIATLLVASPFNTATKHPLVDFVINNDLARLRKQAPKIILYHSRDDEVVPFSNFEDYQKRLPDATTRIFENRGHFDQSGFPELVSDIKKLSIEQIPLKE